MDSKSKRQQTFALLNQVFQETSLDIFESFLKLLKTISGNIIAHSTEDKYRSVRSTNKALQTKFFIHPSVGKLLENLNFAFDGEVYSYYDDDLTVLRELKVIIDGMEVQVEARRNNMNVDPEVARQRQKVIDDEMAEKERKIRELADRVKSDRIDKKDDLKDHPPVTSVANQLQFGAKTKTFDDICPPNTRSK